VASENRSKKKRGTAPPRGGGMAFESNYRLLIGDQFPRLQRELSSVPNERKRRTTFVSGGRKGRKSAARKRRFAHGTRLAG